MIEVKKVEPTKKNGFSLVEVLVTVAILSILIFAICVFMTTGSNLYKKSSREIDLQQEAQTTMNQLYDMTLSANKLNVSYMNPGSEHEVAVMFVQTTEEMDTKVSYIIIWMKDRQKLYFLRKDTSFIFTGTESEITDLCNGVTDEANLLGQYIKSMVIDTSELTKDQAISITIRFEIKDDKYDMTKEIKLRNKQG
jgi:prepilin-type N-terminal cleavage/methylation domain-containing protein